MAEFVWNPLDPEDVDILEDPNSVVTTHLGVTKSLEMDNSESEMVTSGDLFDRASEIIEKIRPFVKKDGGDVHVVGLKKKWLHIQFEGSCQTCSVSSGTILEIEECICEEIPEIKGVEVVQE